MLGMITTYNFINTIFVQVIFFLKGKVKEAKKSEFFTWQGVVIVFLCP